MPVFERTTPESCGVPSASVSAFLTQLRNKAIPTDETHHFMLIRHGKVLSEGSFAPYQSGARHVLYSVSKAFTSTAIGMLIDEGKISLSDRITDYFPEYREWFSEGTEKITVHHLLSMATGKQTGGQVHFVSKEPRPDDILSVFFSAPCVAEPGTVFRYDGNSSYALSRLVTKVTGEHLDAFLQPRLFDRLGIRTPIFERCPQGYCIGQSGMRVSLEEMAALGQLYLQKGVWKGEQILSQYWTELASSKQTDTTNCPTGADWQEGYCYHFWRGRHNTFRFCGAYGQMCVIMPQFDALFLIQSAFDNAHLYQILDTFYDTIFRAFSETPLPEDPTAQKALAEQIAALAVDQPGKEFSKWETL